MSFHGKKKIQKRDFLTHVTYVPIVSRRNFRSLIKKRHPTLRFGEVYNSTVSSQHLYSTYAAKVMKFSLSSHHHRRRRHQYQPKKRLNIINSEKPWKERTSIRNTSAAKWCKQNASIDLWEALCSILWRIIFFTKQEYEPRMNEVTLYHSNCLYRHGDILTVNTVQPCCWLSTSLTVYHRLSTARWVKSHVITTALSWEWDRGR